MRARNVMSGGVMSVNDESTVLEAARLLINSDVNAMPVIDGNGFMVGILSETDVIRHTGGVAPTDLSDLAKAIKAMEEAKSRRVGEIMTTDMVTATEDTRLHDIAELMMKHGIKRVPILRNRSLVGMVSRTDLLRALISVGLEVYAEISTEAQTADERLQLAVMTVLLRLNWSRTPRGGVVIWQGDVHLWGSLPDDAQRAAFVDAVRSVPGVVSVQNHMHIVGPATPVGR